MNIFSGQASLSEVFPYPRVLSEERRGVLECLVDPVQKFVENELTPATYDKQKGFPDELLNALKGMGAFGLQTPEDFGGVGLNNSEYARLVSVFGMKDLALGIVLGAHQSIGYKGILLYGTPQQKKKYLPSLASGEKLAAFCLTEADAGSDAASVKTKATPSADGKYYTLNGSKVWISNAGTADVFTVFAKKPHEKMSDHSTTIHATASAGTDALRNPGPVVRANSMRAGLLNRGRTLGIGCWNVRTLLDPGTQSLTARSLHQYNVDVCCLSEVRLPDSGSREIKIPGVESHFTLYHSGPLDSSGRHGVAIALSQQADLALLAWEPVNDRMAYVRLKGHFTNISIVAVYSPTSAAEQRDKEAFYSQLQALVERLPRRDLLIVAGDWNGRTGPGDSTTSHLLGRFGLGSRCENGERLLNFADRNRLLVTNTCFQHRKKHLLTWYSNDGRTASQIDYILVSSRFRSWVHDSRSMRGAETGNAHGSDHVLVRTRLKVHLSSAPKMPRPRRLNVAKIRQASTAEALSREIRTCFTTRADGEVRNQWSSLKTSVYGAAEKILGYTQRRRSDWISGRTLQLSAQTARARSRNDDYFRQLRKMTSKSARDDRKQYWAEIATSMEQASNVGDTRKLYRLIRQVSGKPSTLSDSVRDVNGGFIADNSAKVERWREHFEHHLNFDTQPTSPLLSSTAEFLPSPIYAVPCDSPSEEEVADAIRKLRNNKAPGEDGIPAEIFKSCVDTLAPWLHEVPVKEADGSVKEKMTAFIVERGFGGVAHGPPEDKMGIKASNTGSLFFDNTKVPAENVLGEVGDGFKVAVKILNQGRFGMAAALSGTMRSAIAQATEHAASRKQFGNTLDHYQSIEEKLANMAVRQYTTESIGFMLSGTMDLGAKDFQLEAAISKVYSSEAAWYCVDEAIQILGGMGFMQSAGLERVLRDLRVFRIFEGANDVLRLFIAGTGCHYAGKNLAAASKSATGILRMAGDRVLRALHLTGNSKAIVAKLPPELNAHGRKLGEAIDAFGGTAESLILKYKKDLIEEQCRLLRLADAAIQIYGTACNLSRVSTSLRDRRQSADYELYLVRMASNTALTHIERSLADVFSKSADENYGMVKRLTRELVAAKGVVQHTPLGF
nr:unnamed protein product [Spirometra erinaceieuropaei]